MSKSIVLTGFMGTGKTWVGKMVAEKLGRQFVDTDAMIETRERQSVREIFETRGEDYFRSLEIELCMVLARKENLVIATGGGTLTSRDNRAAFTNAFVVCLDATPDAILGRINHTEHRPLLSSAPPRQRIEELLNARQPSYAQIKWHIDTTSKSIAQVADQVIQLAQMQQIDVQAPDGSYPIFVGADLLSQVGTLISDHKVSRRCVIITNSRLGASHGVRVVESLEANGLEPHFIEMPDGEKYKTLDSVRTIYDQLIDAKLDRGSIIFALGGGVIGDTAGFAAATFLRGVHCVQLPTTLLAMVDASIGGKVAVDHPRGKNLIGAFKQPLAVIVDPKTLETLPDAEYRSGMAEVVKHGIIGDAELFGRLETGDWRLEVGSWLGRAIQVKVDIVSRDPFEHGERAKLNLGHTFSHAFETLSNFEIRHGDAVAIGIMCATRLALHRKMCDERLVTRIEKLLSTIRLPTRVPREMSANAIIAAMETDKKRVDARLRFLVPRAIGEVDIVDDVTTKEIVAAIEETRV